MLEFLCGTGRLDLAFGDGVWPPHAGFGVGVLEVEGSDAFSLFQRFDNAVPDPFLRAFRKDPFFSAGFTNGRSCFDFFDSEGFVANFFGGGTSEIDDAELIGFLVLF